MSPDATHLTQVTAPSAGAVGILQLQGPEVRDLLQRLTGRDSWPAGKLFLVNLGGIDTGLAVLWRDGPRGWAQLFPHGSPLILRDLSQRLRELGAVVEPQPPAGVLFPEARSALEADMLLALSQCGGSGAIDLLLQQPACWRRWLEEVVAAGDTADIAQRTQQTLERSRILDRYRHPPRVVVLGVPNVGKSTLTNRVLGRSASLVADLPGTTRDWVAGLVELQGVFVCWLDTPGLRCSADPVESQAIDLAKSAIAGADLLVLLRDARHDWPEAPWMPRVPRLKVWNKLDQAPRIELPPDALGISAKTGQGIDALVEAILRSLGLPARPGEPWVFSTALRQALAEHDWEYLSAYAGL